MQLMKDGGSKQWSLYALVFIGTLAMIAFEGCEKTGGEGGGEGESVSTATLKAPPPPPPAYADKHMPEGWWSDPDIIEQGRQLFIGAENIDVNCAASWQEWQTGKKRRERFQANGANAAVL